MRKRNTPLQVSDHALVQYLKLAHGVDIEAAREEVRRLCSRPFDEGAVALQAGELSFTFMRDHVASCMPRQRLGGPRAELVREVEGF